MTMPTDVDELRGILISEGGNPNSTPFQKAELSARERGRLEVERQSIHLDKQRPQWARMLSNGVAGILSFVAVIFVVTVVSLGVLGVTVLMVIAEIGIVGDGIAVVTPHNAWLYSVALVLLYLVMLFIAEIIAHNSSVQPRQRFSLQHIKNWLTYFRGGNRWQAIEIDNPLLRSANGTIRALMVAIVLFGILGRLYPKLLELEGAWYASLWHILSQSSISDMIAYASSAAIAIGLLWGAHFITHFVYLEYVKLTGGVQTKDFFELSSPDFIIEREVSQFYQNEILKLRMRKQQRIESELNS